MSVKYDPTQKTYSVREARAHFSALLQESLDLEQPIIIAKYGKPIAQILPATTRKKKSPNNSKQSAQAQRLIQVKGQKLKFVPISDTLHKIRALGKGKQISSTRSDQQIIEEHLLKKYHLL